MSSRERFQVALLSVALLVIALVGVTVLTFRSSWFANLLRTRVIAAIENTTGARADVGKLTLEWRTFKVRLERVTLHGSEPFGASPLFHADTIEVGLTASSLLSREVRLDSLIIERPGIHIISYPDGKTNFASILRHRAELERQALSFRISDFDLVRGSLLLNATRLHVGFNIHQLTASLNYIPLDRHNPTYLIAVSSPAAKLEITGRQVNSAIEVRARFKGNLLSLDSARVATSASYVTGNGALQISSPVSVQMRLDASVDASDIAPFCPNLKLRSGR
ncbi:MAG: hypothetical protein JO061_05460, partial [Acidobacteriaceae bacterium]|nr:hypothetical protein [Acidobacteriaceae bacterium]